jgi:hypothetical protein
MEELLFILYIRLYYIKNLIYDNIKNSFMYYYLNFQNNVAICVVAQLFIK